ncbi:Na+/H+ antiporter subunit C [Antarcticimicrobium luteum]|uniref:Na+/H+ antiporter subunit C n=1 Tax=Antarcticimicrobium luteum TaxID=2547397 RepID=A0A4R5V9G2_9RHOB|nr:Na+/H+ antiporter subunit C [Antarcticimicrobium luteum]TDK48788.1 Na+/H+ antiporter subunit C [Antarcticimicrobium luteum]
MEILLASAVGILTASGIYLILRQRTFPVIIGLSLLSYAVNLFLFATGRLALNQPPILSKYADASYTDPLPQALVLTAIVISFGMTAVVVMIALSSYLAARDDHIDMAGNGGDDA